MSNTFFIEPQTVVRQRQTMKKDSRVAYRLPTEMKESLERLAERMQLPASTLVRFALQEYMQKIKSEGVMVRPVAADRGALAQDASIYTNSDHDLTPAEQAALEYYQLNQNQRDALYALQHGPVGTIAAGSPTDGDLHVAESQDRPPTLPRKPATYLHPKKLTSNKK